MFRMLGCNERNPHLTSVGKKRDNVLVCFFSPKHTLKQRWEYKWLIWEMIPRSTNMGMGKWFKTGEEDGLRCISLGYMQLEWWVATVYGWGIWNHSVEGQGWPWAPGARDSHITRSLSPSWSLPFSVYQLHFLLLGIGFLNKGRNVDTEAPVSFHSTVPVITENDYIFLVLVRTPPKRIQGKSFDWPVWVSAHPWTNQLWLEGRVM